MPMSIAVPTVPLIVNVALAEPLVGVAAVGVATTLKTVAPATELYAPIAATAKAERKIAGALPNSCPSPETISRSSGARCSNKTSKPVGNCSQRKRRASEVSFMTEQN